MTEHRETPEIEPDRAGEARISASRRFARLVEARVARRVSLPRILAAVAIVLGLLALIGLVGSKLLIRWVASGSEYQVRFSEIELIPMPEPWIVDGKARILGQVRAEANHGETLSLLDLDLEAFEKDFRRCPWVKDVTRLERSYGHLKVYLTYRKPVAVVALGKIAHPIDAEAVYLPHSDIDWIARESPLLVRGIPEPLVEIWGVQSARPPRPGVPWKRTDSGNSPEEDDPMVLRAARLAEFLQGQGRSTPSGRVVPKIVSIHVPDEPGHAYLLRDSGQNLVNWGQAPGDEKPGDPSCEARWNMLLDWVDRNGPLDAKSPSYLYFTRTKAMLFHGGPEKKL